MGKTWSKEDCFNLCRTCKTKTELLSKSRYVYKKMLENGWFDEVDWFEKRHWVSKKWNKESVFNECRKYSSRHELEKNNPYLYRVVKNNNWFVEMDWIKRKPSVYLSGYFVYVYEDDVNKVAYVGLTCEKKRRDLAHRSEMSYGRYEMSPVYNYFINEIHMEIPEPIYLESNISREEAVEKEDFWRYEYVRKGYRVLNKAKTGKGSGSTGGGSIKWTKTKVFEISKNYTDRKSFQKEQSRPYCIARKNGWLDEMTWLKPRYKYWDDKDKVMEEGRKYETRTEFREKSKGAYEHARQRGWLEEMTWFKSLKRSNGYWTKETILEESKKYKNITEFEKYCSRAVAIARKEGWKDKIYKL